MAELRVIQCDRCGHRQDLGTHLGWLEVKVESLDFAKGATDVTYQFCKECRIIVQSSFKLPETVEDKQ